jgi:hypothetical protein
MRYINLCPPKKKGVVQQPGSMYQRYIKTHQHYENTPQRKAYMKEYNKEYNAKHSEEVVCDCGSVYKSSSSYAHIKTNKHIAYLTT